MFNYKTLMREATIDNHL